MSNFSCDSFEQIEKNLEKLFVPKYYPGFILSIYENGNESYFLKKGYDDIFKKKETCPGGRSPIAKCIGWHSLSEEKYLEMKKKWEEDNV